MYVVIYESFILCTQNYLSTKISIEKEIKLTRKSKSVHLHESLPNRIVISQNSKSD